MILGREVLTVMMNVVMKIVKIVKMKIKTPENQVALVTTVVILLAHP